MEFGTFDESELHLFLDVQIYSSCLYCIAYDHKVNKML